MDLMEAEGSLHKVSEPLEQGTRLAHGERLKELFKTLDQRQQAWLLMRFPGCQSDEEASARLKESGMDVPHRTKTRWKKDDRAFIECYDLMRSNLVDVVAHVNSAEVGEAIRVAMLEALELLKTQWAQMITPGLIKAKTDLIMHFTGGKARSTHGTHEDDGDAIRKLSKVIE